MIVNRIYIKTHEDNDGYIANHEYVFDDHEEAVKFVNGKIAANSYGEKVCKSYYETIMEATADINVDKLRELGENEMER